ncbi:hypothetical protein MNEG_14731 [Monoraphidium neglectum]|uniref:Aldehyde dehydrogenase domain-containing protein n=1 Tax=Monoraphidium neglectum TaxID=145388 RepID=A0A0D2IZG1_9CHLO|nr:hypothetical protein MNEG_14731 [Monoraphidium neglectum]KIY93232.1 hypothetical protein MNEG_14731 [Monoraphidium neglectum]|eukprot:XP_013892252.1 hypothetical protein MNEG_14731 [Monoraphidium neglectum]
MMRRVGEPKLTKEVTAELGNVTPYIIVPGPWSDDDILYHASNVASGLAQNNGHNCLAAEIVVTSKDWPLREKFVSALRACLSGIHERAAWYPGSDAKRAAFTRRFGNAEGLGRPVPGAAALEGGLKPQPWLLAAGGRRRGRGPGPEAFVSAGGGGASAARASTQEENWCGVLQEVALPGCGGDAAAFLGAAVDYANKQCWGTLACSVFVHPETQRRHAEAWEAALEGLRFGSICVNCPATTGFVATPLVWGAYPGNTPQDIGSGDSYVHNTYLLDHPEKSVCHAPWTYSPQPLWSVFQLGLEAAMPPALRYIVSQDRPLVALAYLMQVAVHALRGSVPPPWPWR